MLFEVPLSDQAVVDKEAAQWAELWQAESEYHTPDFGNDIEQLQPLLVVGVREAARTFPIHTGLGADNLAPRAVARLSNDSMHMLCLLFMAFEATGGWCQALNLVLIVLLPKSDGGRRPIGLFCTLIRVWMRARLWAVRKWEAANALPGVFAGPEMGAQKAAWQAAFAAESANLAVSAMGRRYWTSSKPLRLSRTMSWWLRHARQPIRWRCSDFPLPPTGWPGPSASTAFSPHSSWPVVASRLGRGSRHPS
jgi:hypothetical protein